MCICVHVYTNSEIAFTKGANNKAAWYPDTFLIASVEQAMADYKLGCFYKLEECHRLYSSSLDTCHNSFN